MHAPVEKFEIELLDSSQAGKEKTRPNKQRAVTIRQVRVPLEWLLSITISPILYFSLRKE